MPQSSRRRFLKQAVLGSGLAGVASSPIVQGLKPLAAEDVAIDSNIVQFRPEIEPLVRLLEETPREKLIEKIAQRINGGLSYREVLAALLLAGVRNVQPRPSVGFKFHAVLVVNSAHVASMSSPDADRWLPILWAIDNFKSSQARDVREGNWTMAPVNEAAIPDAGHALTEFSNGMDRWDEQKTDAAVAGLMRTSGANELFELFARYGVRDFRSIGHKAIYVANSWRTLHCIGWQHAEPVLRSLAYALLNHNGEPNPANSDLDADRPGRTNAELVKKIRADWRYGNFDSSATTSLLKALRSETPNDCCHLVVELLNNQVSPQSVFDGLFLGAGELLMRQPGIVALHAVTTTNAMHYMFQQVSSDFTRRMILLQNAAFLPLFREAMKSRGKVANHQIDQLDGADLAKGENAVSQIMQDVGQDRHRAAGKLLTYLTEQGSAESIINAARRQIFLKGRDSHDYKFSSAALEDFYHVSPEWRNRFLASSVFKLRGAQEQENGLVKRIQSAFS